MRMFSGDEFAVDDDAGRDVHATAPVCHSRVSVIADVGVVERSPASEENSPAPDLFVAGEGFIHEIEEVIVQRNHLLHELDVLHEADNVVGKELDCWDGSNSAGIEG